MLLQLQKRYRQLLSELQGAVAQKGLVIELNELERVLDVTFYEKDNERMIRMLVNKLQFEKELNNFTGLANGVKLAYEVEHA